MKCLGCGAAADSAGPQPSACGECPPSTCEECGGVNHIATSRMCSCWVSVEDLAPADIKAIFAADGTFNVGIDGELTVAE